MASEIIRRVLKDPDLTLIDVGFIDPKNLSIFGKPKGNEREVIKYYLCSCPEKCEAYKNGQCLLRTGLYGTKCPYGRARAEEGYTVRARTYDSWLDYRKDKYKNTIKNLKEVKTLTEIGEEHIFLPLEFLNNYVNPISADLGMYTQYLINKKLFTPETVIKLVTYQPRALIDNSIIKEYTTKYLPDFVYQLSRKYPDIYNEVKETVPDIEIWVKSPEFVGKKAKLKSLLPGKVKFSTHVGYWDGEKVVTDSKELVLFGWNDNEEVHIFPTDKTVVEIVDNATVDEDKVEFV